MKTDAFANQPLFGDPAVRARFPAPIAAALEVMAYELEHSGEATTADELAAAIEATFTWLGKLWTAEYLAAVERDARWVSESLQRDIVDRVAAGSPMRTGEWVGMARALRAQLEGLDTVVPDLVAIDFGGLATPAHPVSRLLHFRNHFSHGSFASTTAEIREHRQLLHDLLARVPGLRECEVLCREPETGLVRVADGLWQSAPAPPGIHLPESEPVLVAKDGRFLQLYPLLHASFTDDPPVLKSADRTHPALSLLRRPALAGFLERYERERQGFLRYPGPEAFDRLPAASASELREQLRRPRPGLILLESHPGCGVEGAVAALVTDDPLTLGLARYAALGRVRISPDDVGQSGLTVARVVLRLVESALGERPGQRQADALDVLSPRGPLAQALADLARAGKEVALGLLDLHHGARAYRGEPLTVGQVYEFLLDGPVTVIATTMPGALHRPLYDRRILVPIHEAPRADEVTRVVRELTEHRRVHVRALRELAEAEGPLHLFALCDRMEAREGDTLLEPAVERALWDLRPLLAWHREPHEEDGVVEHHRVWRVFSPVVSRLVLGAQP